VVSDPLSGGNNSFIGLIRAGCHHAASPVVSSFTSGWAIRSGIQRDLPGSSHRGYDVPGLDPRSQPCGACGCIPRPRCGDGGEADAFGASIDQAGGGLGVSTADGDRGCLPGSCRAFHQVGHAVSLSVRTDRHSNVDSRGRSAYLVCVPICLKEFSPVCACAQPGFPDATILVSWIMRRPSTLARSEATGSSSRKNFRRRSPSALREPKQHPFCHRWSCQNLVPLQNLRSSEGIFLDSLHGSSLRG